MSAFERWWESYWSNRTDTVEHTISRSIAYDAWWAARRNARGDEILVYTRPGQPPVLLEDAIAEAAPAIRADERAKVTGEGNT